MRSAVATRRLTFFFALLTTMGWGNHVYAQFGAGTTWVRTDAQGKGITLTLEACCNGGLRLIYLIPPIGGQPAATMTVDSPLDGRDVPVLFGGKPSGETMAITRLDDHHYKGIVKMSGQPFGTSNGTVSPDGKSMTVETISQGGGTAVKVIETWVRK